MSDTITVPREIRHWVMARAQAPSVENRSEVLDELMRALGLNLKEADVVATACGYPPHDHLSTFRALMDRGGGAVVEMPRSVAVAILDHCDALTAENDRLRALLASVQAPSSN